ncbi:MAG: hypothetical protein K2H49_05910, partial [Muribaculaceae bacterium]|nr:hypothetical protein [Muribaculaceae bacterium]
AVARRFNVSNLIIGLTVVALGSTMPDIVVCVESAFQDKPALAMGEVIGANIFDLLLVVGIMGIVRPFKVSCIMRSQDLPILFIASSALWIAGDSVLFDGAHHNVINRSAGIMLILIFVFYMWFMILSSKNQQAMDSDDSDDGAASTDVSAKPDENVGISSAHAVRSELSAMKAGIATLKGKHWFSWVMITGGLGALVVGGNWVVDGASGLALKVGMSQAMVALTVVAIGNALPDLVTSVTATVKGASGIAFGNIVGSCIINTLLTIGLSALVIPLKADSIGFVDFITLVGGAALLWIFPMLSKKRNIGHAGGIILVALYVAYMTFTIIRG